LLLRKYPYIHKVVDICSIKYHFVSNWGRNSRGYMKHCP